MRTPFAKYHALGNDFIIIEQSRRPTRSQGGKLALGLCDRNTGIGADGLVILSPSRTAEARFDIFNADGGWAEMSGNGLRMAALHRYFTHGRRRHRFDTATFSDEVVIHGGKGRTRLVSASLGPPDFHARAVGLGTRLHSVIGAPMRFGEVAVPLTCVSVGNPHVVIEVTRFAEEWPETGRRISESPQFARGVNVEFARRLNRKRIEVRLWERGVGVTRSSGTGAAAAVCAMVMRGRIDRKCTVRSVAGEVEVHWHGDSDLVELSGPVTFIARGIADLP